MANPSPKANKPETVYLNPREDFSQPNPAFVRMSPQNLNYFVGEGEIERVKAYKPRRDGSFKEVWIWRVCDAMFKTRYDFRGQSCSASPAYVEKLADALADEQGWARTTINFFRFREPVLQL